MKKLSFTILAVLTTILALAQFNEYRYFSIKFGLINNYIPVPKENPDVLHHTPLGDMKQYPIGYINFTPGVEVGSLFHFDSKNDKFGVVVGALIANYGFTINYKTETFNFKLTDQYRVTTIEIPVFIKYNSADLYINQTYLTLGFRYYMNIFVTNIQKASWSSNVYINNLSSAQFHKITTAIDIGVNYNIYYLNLEYQLQNFINKNFKTITTEGIISPYQHLDFQSKIYLTLGIHIPLTRWITMRSWTAERIRRIFQPVK